MLFLFILGNFNKSTKLRLPECRAVLSGREPRALPQLGMTSMSHQVAGTIWMPDSLLVTPFGNVIVLYYAWHRSYTIHKAAAGEREQVLRCRGAPRAQHGLSENRICWWRHPPPPPSDSPSQPHEAAREAPSPDLWGHGGPCPALTAMLLLKDTSAGFSALLFWGTIHLLFTPANSRCWFHFALLSSATCMHSEHHF